MGHKARQVKRWASFCSSAFRRLCRLYSGQRLPGCLFTGDRHAHARKHRVRIELRLSARDCVAWRNYLREYRPPFRRSRRRCRASESKGSLANDSILTQFTVEVQLKATKKVPVEQDGKYSYSLKVKNFDELRSTNTGVPQLLVVLFLACWTRTHG